MIDLFAYMFCALRHGRHRSSSAAKTQHFSTQKFALLLKYHYLCSAIRVNGLQTYYKGVY